MTIGLYFGYNNFYQKYNIIKKKFMKISFLFYYPKSLEEIRDKRFAFYDNFYDNLFKY